MEHSENDEKIITFAKTNFRNQNIKFGIKQVDRRRHMYLIGKTGMGKSTVMENMIIQDIIDGHGVALVDPHGDFAEKILDFIPNHRINDVIYFNPADINYPIAFNVMEAVNEEYKHLIASGLVGVFKKLWADSWGPRLEYLLRNAILALLDYPSSTLLGVLRIFVDKNYRKKVIDKIQDPVVKAFWVEEYSKYPQQFQVEAVSPIQNKVGQFLSTALIRNVVGQVKSSFDLRDIMDNQKILIMNLSKGRIGEDSSALLGAMMITKIQLAAMSRIDIPEEDRKDFYLYVDEFQNFATQSFSSILSEARKYRLDLIIGHQYVEQLDEDVRAAVFGNVGTIMCFRVGSADAEFLATEFAPYFVEEDLVNLAKYDTYMKLMIDGVASNPFSASTLPPLGAANLTKNKQKVIDVSRERYARPRDVVEDKISRWSGVMDEKEETKTTTPKETATKEVKKEPKPIEAPRVEPIRKDSPKRVEMSKLNKLSEEAPKKKKKKSKESYTINCYECGKTTQISFKPDGIRPVYCDDCFKKIKEGTLVAQDKGELKEVAAVPAPEISLSEALTQKPKAFDNKKIEPNHTPTPIAPVVPPIQLDHPESQKQASPTTTKSEVEKTTSAKPLEPGEVVKF